MELISEAYEKVDSMNYDILLAVSREGTDEEQQEEISVVSEYKERYRMAKVKADNFLEAKLDPVRPDSSDTTQCGLAGPKKTYKLRKIEIRKFNGDLREWLGFWTQFEKIHEDSTLHDSDKFQYLVQSMVTGTRACQLVSSYPQAAANYPLVIAALKDRFGDKVLLLLTEVYVRQLLRLVIKNVNGRSKAGPLSVMYDELVTS